MTSNQLSEWLFQNGHEDQWWLSLDSVTVETVLTIAEMEERVKEGEYLQIQALHVSQADMQNPPWVDFEIADRVEPPASPPATRIPGKAKAADPSQPDETLGIIILLIPLVSAVLIWFWVGSMNLLQNPGSTLAMLVALTVVGTGVLVAVEAGKLGIGSNEDRDTKGKKKMGPVGWAAFVILLWIVGFPAYLAYRSRYGAKNMIVGGIAVALIFMGAASMINMAIDGAKANLRRGVEEFQDYLR